RKLIFGKTLGTEHKDKLGKPKQDWDIGALLYLYQLKKNTIYMIFEKRQVLSTCPLAWTGSSDQKVLKGPKGCALICFVRTLIMRISLWKMA
ncbi:hypothetical protein ACJX0J_006174, partial [Zea mays]